MNRFVPACTAVLVCYGLAFSGHAGVDAMGGPAVAAAQAAQAAPAAPLTDEQVLTRYCVSCHNDRLQTAGLSLSSFDLANPAADPVTGEKIIRKLRAGLMPPAGMPRPDRATLDHLRATIEDGIDRVALANVDPGVTSLHRLNRAEYANAVHDLLAVDVDTSTLLPADDSFEGFDNIADVLGTSPVLIERYIGAAAKISRLAVGNTDIGPQSVTYKVRGDLSQDDHIEGLPLGTRGGIVIRHTFPVDGEYLFKFSLLNVNFGPRYGGAAKDEQIEMSVNGERVLLLDLPSTRYYYIGGGRGGGRGGGGRAGGDGAAGGRGTGGPGAGQGAAGQGAGGLGAGGREGGGRVGGGGGGGGRGGAQAEPLEIQLPIEAGPQTIAVTFVKRSDAYVDDLVQRFESTTGDLQTGVQFGYTTVPHLSAVEIVGPYGIEGPGDTPSRARIFTCRPADAAGELPCARQILAALARRAYRRPVTDADLAPLLDFYAQGRANGGFEQGIEMGVRRLLADPQFVFRFEREPDDIPPGTPYPILDIELASRLSFFLWSSIPDEELLDVAEQGRLRDPDVLATQVRRMLRDPRAQALVTNFAGQWLFLRDLRNRTPDLLVYPDFDDNLRQAFLRETELLFASIVDEDRPVFDLLDADYTFVNERLARHYRIPHVYGSDFRRVPVTDDARRGLLGHGSILTVTSAPNRTAPVIRGAWILENLLGAPPPVPPPDVPSLPETEVGQGVNTKPKTVRERMEQHRSNPTCRSCHQIMDPVGLALEYFDGVGAWRTTEAGAAIDATGQLVDGTVVNGPSSLRRALLEYPDAFVQTLTGKLLMYATGRGAHDSDMPVVRAIARAAARDDYRFSSIVLGIVNSAPFQMRIRKADLEDGDQP